jgi:hypothetical protein
MLLDQAHDASERDERSETRERKAGRERDEGELHLYCIGGFETSSNPSIAASL